MPGTKPMSDRAAKEHPDAFKVMPLPAARTRTDGRRYIALLEGLNVRLPLKRVIVGPWPNQAEIGVKAAALLGDVPITFSQCPLGAEAA